MKLTDFSHPLFCAFAMLMALLMSARLYAQEKQTVQVKTYDESLKPYPDIELSVNGKAFISLGSRGVAFMEIEEGDLPIKSVTVNDRKLEAASWNYSKGIIQVILRKKTYEIVHVTVKDSENRPLPNISVAFKGKASKAYLTDGTGKFEMPLPLDDKISSAAQFSISGYVVKRIASSGTETTVIADRPAPVEPLASAGQEIQKKGEVATQEYFKDFDISLLDSIQSLTVFYAIFKDYPSHTLTDEARQRMDLKFHQLVNQLKDTVQLSPLALIGNITDSSFVNEDVKYLLEQAILESNTLTEQREEFNEKIRIIKEKLSTGIQDMNESGRAELLADLALLERMLIDNESRFFKNQNDYKQIITSIRDKYFDIETLEGKLSESEAQRLEEQRVFRQRLIAITAVVLVFGCLIVLLISFSTRLRKKKKLLERANAEIQHINENLEGLVFERTKLLEEANRELDTFLYRASHDMRSPVRSILGLCNIAGHLSDGEPKQLIDRVVTTTMGMDKLLKKLSIISEINQPTDFTSIKLLEMIKTIDVAFRKIVLEKNIDLHVECPSDLVIWSYPSILQTILTNILENALFFSAQGQSENPKVKLKVRMESELLILVVENNGMEIDPSFSSQIFNMFFKGTEKSNGHGLGLYIVQKAVQALNGEVVCESPQPRWTRFTVRIPQSKKTFRPSIAQTMVAS